MGSNGYAMEHRWGNRFELDAPAELQTPDGRSAAARVRNASVSGAFIETQARPPVLSRVSVRPLAHPDEWHEACVVRADTGGLAVEWLDPGQQAVSPLLALRVPATPQRRADASASERPYPRGASGKSRMRKA